MITRTAPLNPVQDRSYDEFFGEQYWRAGQSGPAQARVDNHLGVGEIEPAPFVWLRSARTALFNGSDAAELVRDGTVSNGSVFSAEDVEPYSLIQSRFEGFYDSTKPTEPKERAGKSTIGNTATNGLFVERVDQDGRRTEYAFGRVWHIVIPARRFQLAVPVGMELSPDISPVITPDMVRRPQKWDENESIRNFADAPYRAWRVGANVVRRSFPGLPDELRPVQIRRFTETTIYHAKPTR